jgi:uncharacterized membrane protein YoaK (UPF0700 family)
MVDAIYFIFCFALLYSCFCRATRMHKDNTKRAVRWAFQLLTVSACTALAAPMLWAYRPDWVVTMLLGAFVAVQIVTASYWTHDVPNEFQK